MALVSSTVSVGTSSTALLTVTSANRGQKVILSNFGANPVTVSANATTVIKAGILVPANSTVTIDLTDMVRSGHLFVPTLTAIAGTGACDVGVTVITGA